MIIAIPTSNGKLCMHFGHCQNFTLFNVDQSNKSINNTVEIAAPPHQPGLLPRWLAEKKVKTVIAGGMGQRAQNLFSEHNIQVITGVSSDEPAELVKIYLEGDLKSGKNLCDH